MVKNNTIKLFDWMAISVGACFGIFKLAYMPINGMAGSYIFRQKMLKN